jgi:hypothetical protein
MTEYSNEEIVDSFLDHIRYLTIAHHVSGRIRVKADWNGAKKLARLKENEIEPLIARIPGILEYRVNKKALSIVISYDPEILSFSLWEAIGALSEYPLHRDEIGTRLLAMLNQN